MFHRTFRAGGLDGRQAGGRDAVGGARVVLDVPYLNARIGITWRETAIHVNTECWVSQHHMLRADADTRHVDNEAPQIAHPWEAVLRFSGR